MECHNIILYNSHRGNQKVKNISVVFFSLFFLQHVLLSKDLLQCGLEIEEILFSNLDLIVDVNTVLKL